MMFLLVTCVVVFAQMPTASFIDSDLQSVIDHTRGAGSSAVIYGWSPHMPWSVRGLDELRRFGFARSLTVVPVLDPGANDRLAEEVLIKHKWPKAYLRRAASPRLFALGFRIHYPTYLLISHGKLATNILPGYKTPGGLAPYLRRYL